MSAKAETHMGRQHESGPITSADRVMSHRHLAHRAEVDMIRDPKKKLKQSIKYNLAHAKEHMKALKDNQKQLKKLAR